MNSFKYRYTRMSQHVHVNIYSRRVGAPNWVYNGTLVFFHEEWSDFMRLAMHHVELGIIEMEERTI